MFPASTKKGGVAVTAGPLDVCRVPAPPAPFVPLPYANMVDGLAGSGDEAGKRTQKKIIDKAKKHGIDAKSATSAVLGAMGNEAGTLKGGIVSNTSKAAEKLMFGTSNASKDAPPGRHVVPSQTKVVILGG